MHEASLVEEVVGACLHVAGHGPVEVVRLRRTTDIGEEELRLLWSIVVEGTALAGAALEIDVVSATISCGCGFSGSVAEDAVLGQVAVCPACGDVRECRVPPGIEIIEVRPRCA